MLINILNTIINFLILLSLSIGIIVNMLCHVLLIISLYHKLSTINIIKYSRNYKIKINNEFSNLGRVLLIKIKNVLKLKSNHYSNNY